MSAGKAVPRVFESSSPPSRLSRPDLPEAGACRTWDIRPSRLLIDGALVGGAAPPRSSTRPPAARSPPPCADPAQLAQAVGARQGALSPLGPARPGRSGRRCSSHIADRLEAGARFAPPADASRASLLAESRGEMEGAIAAFRHFATLALPPRVLRDTPDERIVEHRHPLGVVAAIVPWNYPLLMLALEDGAGPASRGTR